MVSVCPSAQESQQEAVTRCKGRGDSRVEGGSETFQHPSGDPAGCSNAPAKRLMELGKEFGKDGMGTPVLTDGCEICARSRLGLAPAADFGRSAPCGTGKADPSSACGTLEPSHRAQYGSRHCHLPPWPRMSPLCHGAERDERC